MRLCGRRYQCIDDWQVQYSDIGKKRRAAVMFTMRFSEWTWQNIFVRIVFSLVLGIVIGIDRGQSAAAAAHGQRSLSALAPRW